jgi:hypothetical protein
MRHIYIVYCLITLLFVGDSLAQELPPSLRWDPNTLVEILPPELNRDPYVVQFLIIAHKWNMGTVEYPTFGTLRVQFNNNLERAVEQRWQSYATSEWAESRSNKFNAFAEKSGRPQLKIDRQAILTLTLAFANNVPLMRKKFKPQSLEKELILPTYIIFNDSQERALKAKHPYIMSVDILPTIFEWWTNVWPFCAPTMD